jgi:endoglucanase
MSAASVTRRSALAGAAALAASGARAQPQRLITGVNLAGLEFASGKLPGRLDTDFVAPTVEELDYYRAAGARAVRIPFLWERAQPELGGPLDEAYVGLLDTLVTASREREMRLVLDPHQYGRRRHEGRPVIIGEGAVTGAHFAAFWGQLARRYRDADHVIFGLQNEPHDQDTIVLIGVLNGAIAAIRRAGARQLILVPGNAWSGAHSWVSSGNTALLAVRDPAGNMAFDVHQFLDADSSGTSRTCAENAGNRLGPFMAWAREHRRRGFLSEFGAADHASCPGELEHLLITMANNRDVWIGWTYWAGGPWWDDDYPLSIEPASLRNPEHRPQMRILQRYFQ